MPAMRLPRWISIALLSTAALVAQQNATDRWSTSVKRSEQLDAEGRFPEAAEAAKLALQSAQSFGPTDSRRAIAYLSLGTVYRDWLQCDQSPASLAAGARIWKQQANPDPKDAIYAFATLSSLISEVNECGDPEAAESLFHAYRDDLQRFRSSPLDDARILRLQGEFSRRQRHNGEAQVFFEQALQIMERTGGANPARIAETRSALATVLTDLGRPERALQVAQQAVAGLEQIDALHPALPDALNTFAYAQFKAGRRQEAARTYQRGVSLARQIFGDDNRMTAVLMINYAVVLKALKRNSEAAAINHEGQEAYRRISLRNARTTDVEELKNVGSGR